MVTSCGRTEYDVIVIGFYIRKEDWNQVAEYLNPRIKGRTVKDALDDIGLEQQQQ